MIPAPHVGIALKVVTPTSQPLAAKASFSHALNSQALKSGAPARSVQSPQPMSHQISLKTQSSMLQQVTSAQRRLDQILKLAESGKSFSAGELLAMQTHAYQASQQIDVASKCVEKSTSGVKQILQTQI